MIVRSLMTPHPITLRLDSNPHAALDVMQQHAIRHLPVVSGDDRVLGIVAERDLLLAVLRDHGASVHHGPTGALVQIADIMQRAVVCVRDDAPITHAATLMARHAIGGLPVLNARERVVGIITETDILRAFVEVLEAKTARSLEMVQDAETAALLVDATHRPGSARTEVRRSASAVAPAARTKKTPAGRKSARRA